MAGKRNPLLTVIMALLLLLATDVSFGQTTGKVAGRIIDAKTGEALPGVNISLEGSSRGASTDVDGYYFIVNVPPASYSLRISMLGYESVLVENVQVSVNRTANISIELKEAVVAGDEVIVTAKRVAIKKDQTASVKNISAEQIADLPVDDLQAVIEQQAGVVGGHFRGGRLTEVSYLVDGMQVDDGFSGTSGTLEPETEVVQDLEVITGTFNAEYGRALSGIVNVITKDGSNEYSGSFSSSLANYYTANDDIFIGLKGSEVDRNLDYKLNLSGPLVRDKLFFLANYRYQDLQGHHNGINRFLPNDYSELAIPVQDLGVPVEEIMQSQWLFEDDGQLYYSEHRGDNSFVPMSTSLNKSFFGKLTYKPFTAVKLSFLYTRDEDEFNGDYNHGFKYIPTIVPTTRELSNLYLFQLNHLINNNLFYDLKVSLNDFQQTRFLYEDPLDSRYVSDNYDVGGAGFRLGGQDRIHADRSQTSLNTKFDINWQLNKRHSLQTGVLYTQHETSNNPQVIRNSQFGQAGQNQRFYDPVEDRITFVPYLPEVLTENTVGVDIYEHEPYEFSAYIQDKMEFDEMVLNIGLRYDYFNPNTVYPSQLRNPGNQLSFPNNPERISEYLDADPKEQLSPRVGLAYRLGDISVVRFSYGHFFQIPPFTALYQNSSFLVPPGDFDIVHGNPQIKPERTIQYEFGVWMELRPGMGLEVAMYNRDIYDLQSAIVVTTYNQIRYGLFSNKDYGNVKGLELKYDVAVQNFNFWMNYTLQFTRGNADNPTSSFSRIGQSRDPITQLIPLSWDQRHTFNFTAGYTKKDYGVNLTMFYNSGLPYSFVPISESPLAEQPLLPNNAVRPANYTLDLRAHYDLRLFGEQKLRLSLLVFNLLDRLNELQVNQTTGRAYTAIVRPTEITTFRSNFNDILDDARNPGMFSAPRQVKLVVGLAF